MRLSNRTLMMALLFVILGTTAAYAEQKGASNVSKSDQLVVLSTAVDRANQTLTVQGLGFGSQPPQVWCGTYPMTVISVTDTQLIVFLPAGVPDGTHLLTVLRGSGEKDRAYFNMAVQTPGQGPTGPAGPMGPAGPKGAAGAKGDTGAAGPKGDTGAAGPKGDVGAVGPKGDTGASGPKGDTGAAGPKGDTGAAGPQGEAGPKGDTGPQGAVGPTGNTGAVGPQGPVGPAGPDGLKGDTGATGATGATGPQGSQGSQGPQGPQGPQGLMGPLGPQGLPGVSGLQIVSTALVTVTTLDANQLTTMSVRCPVGKNVIAGGYDMPTPGLALHAVSSYPSALDTWLVTVRLSQPTIEKFQFRVYGVCASK